MKDKILKISLIIFLFGVAYFKSAAQFTIDAQLRPRFGFSQGYSHLVPDSVDPAWFISQRTRLSFGFENSFLKIRITPQDVRIWGNESVSSSMGVFGNESSLDLFEGYLQLRLGRWGWVSVGRQELIYDKERLFSARNWNQMGIAYDAVVLKTAWKKWKLDVGGSWNSMIDLPYENTYPSNRIKSLNFVWVHWEPAEGIQTAVMHVASGVTSSDTTSNLFWKQTSGIIAEVNRKNFTGWMNVYYQFGRTNKNVPVNAFLADVFLYYKVSFFTPGCGISYLSGNSQTGSQLDCDHLFDPFYGARHRYFGFQDYFNNIPGSTKQGGLADYFLSLKFSIIKKISILDMPHYFQLAQTNPTTPGSKNLGFENDLIINYQFTSWGNLEFGYCFLLPTGGFKKMQGVENNAFAQFSYLQLTVKPTLLNYSFKESKSN